MKVESEIRHRVIEALRGTSEAAHIGVSVEHEVVTLAGTVHSLGAKTAAEEIVSRVDGVSAVVNRLRIDSVSWLHPLIQRILVPVDLSDERVGALRYARLFAEKLGSSVTVATIDSAPGDPRLRRMVELYAEPHLEPYPFEIAIASGDVADAILGLAATSSSDLIVIGSTLREQGGHLPSRSVSLAVADGASCPVLSIGEHDYPAVDRGVGVTRIVCLVDPGVDRQTVLLAAKLAEVFDAQLIVLRVVEPEEPTELVPADHVFETWLGEGIRPYRRVVARGRPVEQTLECVARFDADLLVVGAPGELAGTTAEQLLRTSPTHVLTVPFTWQLPHQG